MTEVTWAIAAPVGENVPVTTCAACGAANPAEFRFCGSCGAALGARACPSCGFAVPIGHRFCGQCGSPLGPTAAGPPGPDPIDRPGLASAVADERKLATVLFADVVGFTSMSEGADPETVARTVDAAFRRMAEVVTQHGGTVDKYLGDCLMAVFGVPRAHDNDAERAVAAGLAMRELGGDLAFSIGINTGEVMVTAVGRDGEITVIGDTVNVAARLEKAAGPGEVLVGRLTAELAGSGVVFRDRQPVVLKGKRDPVGVWEAVALRADAAGGLAACDRPPLVGRADELAFLRAQWRQTVQGTRSAVVLLCGDAGVGKTRLIDELAEELEPEGAHVVRATYPAYGGMGGPRVAAQVVRQLGPSGDLDIDARARSLAGELHPSLRAIDPGAIEKEQLWAFHRLIEMKAAERPIFLSIDDIHRCTDRTLELLAELMYRVADVPILLVLVGRPDPPDWLTSFPTATTVRLSALTDAQAASLAQSLVADGPLGPAAVAALVARSGGNPLHLRELVGVVRAQGGLVASDDGWSLAGGIALPPSLHAILAARLDHLPAVEKQCLQHVAVLGDAATRSQVEALGTAEAAGALRALVVSRLLRQTSHDAYDIADPLVREVAYETLPRHVRGALHQRAAAVAESSLERARHLDRAARYLDSDRELAAEAATALGTASTELLERRRTLDGIQVGLRAVELGFAEPAALLAIALALTDVGRSQDALAVLDRFPDVTDDPVLEAERVHARGAAVMVQSPADSLPMLEEAAERWAALGNDLKEGWAWSNRGVALFFLGRSADSEESLLRGLARFREVKSREGELSVYRFLSLVRPDDARVATWLAEALAHAEAVGDRTGQLNSLDVLMWNSYLRLRLGGEADAAAATDFTRRFTDLAREMGVRDWNRQGFAVQSNLARLTGRMAEAERFAAAAAGTSGELAAAEADATSHSLATLAAATSWSAAVAAGRAAGPPPVATLSTDPIVALAGVIVGEELLFSGRIGEIDFDNLAGYPRPAMHGIEAIVGGMLEVLSRLVRGDLERARLSALEAAEVARKVDALPAWAAATALLAELAVRMDGEAGMPEAQRLLAELPQPSPGGVAGALILRARATMGEPGAAEALAAATRALHAAGLAAGIG